MSVLSLCYFPGVAPQTLEEWKLLIQLSQRCSSEGVSEQVTGVNGSSWSNGSADCGRKISPENLTLMLARTAGPDRAMAVLEECGVQLVLSPHSKLVCELLRVTEKRQRWVSQGVSYQTQYGKEFQHCYSNMCLVVDNNKNQPNAKFFRCSCSSSVSFEGLKYWEKCYFNLLTLLNVPLEESRIHCLRGISVGWSV